MLFHELRREEIECLDRQPKTSAPVAPDATLHILWARLGLALLLPLAFSVLALASHWLEWQLGETTFLHLVELLIGAVIGAFFGERQASQRPKP